MSSSPPLRDRLITATCRLLARVWDRAPARRQSLPDVPRILVLKPCCLGDVLMATPAIAALRARWPTATLDLAVGGWSRAVVESNPHLDRLVDCGLVGSGPSSPGDWLTLIRRIRQGQYDVCIVLDRSPLLSFAAALAGVPHRVGLNSDWRGFSLTQRVPVAGIAHEVDLYLACVEALGVPVGERALQFFPTPAAAERVSELLGGSRDPIAVVHPAGGQNPGMTLSAKRWPAERFALLIRHLVQEKTMRVFLAGGADDRPLAELVRASAAVGESAVNLAGDLNLDELGALLTRSLLFVGNDTGAMHLAVAVGVPTVAIFGPSDPRQYGPYGPAHRAVWNPPACAPCLVRGRWNGACADYRCINAIQVEEVWQAILDVLP